MKGDAAIQFENESFQRLYSGVMLSIIDETEQALLYSGTDESPEEILVLDSVRVTAFATENVRGHKYSSEFSRRSIYIPHLN